MKSPVDAQRALLFRWIALPLGTVAMVVGLGIMPIVPAVRGDGANPAWTSACLGAILAGASLLFLAAWLRVQEALDPANEDLISRSLKFHFGVYLASALGITVMVRSIL